MIWAILCHFRLLNTSNHTKNRDDDLVTVQRMKTKSLLTHCANFSAYLMSFLFIEESLLESSLESTLNHTAREQNTQIAAFRRFHIYSLSASWLEIIGFLGQKYGRDTGKCSWQIYKAMHAFAPKKKRNFFLFSDVEAIVFGSLNEGKKSASTQFCNCAYKLLRLRRKR